MSEAPTAWFQAPVSPGARLLGCLLWRYVAGPSDAPAIVTVPVAEIRRRLDMSKATVERHFRELRCAGLVVALPADEQGRFSSWRLSPDWMSREIDSDVQARATWQTAEGERAQHRFRVPVHASESEARAAPLWPTRTRAGSRSAPHRSTIR